MGGLGTKTSEPDGTRSADSVRLPLHCQPTESAVGLGPDGYGRPSGASLTAFGYCCLRPTEWELAGLEAPTNRSGVWMHPFRFSITVTTTPRKRLCAPEVGGSMTVGPVHSALGGSWNRTVNGNIGRELPLRPEWVGGGSCECRANPSQETVDLSQRRRSR